jgi:UDPglucose 6-dehydrogenase
MNNDYVFGMKVVQVGCGVVGSAYIHAFKERGFDMVGIDINPKVLKELKDDNIEAYHPDEFPTTIKANIVLVSVPTLLIEKTQRLNMNSVYSTLPFMKQLIMQSQEEQPIIILRSTLPPGETRKYRHILEEMMGDDYKDCFRIAFQPEFLRANSAYDDACSPWRVVIGINETDNYYNETKQELLDFFTKFVSEELIYVLNIEEAEFMKLVHNYFNGLKISFANTIYGIAQELPYDIDAAHILTVVSNTAEGFLNKNYGLTPGMPYGGTCLPKDIPELTMLAPENSPFKDFVHSTTAVNKYIAEITQKQPIIKGHNWVSNSYLSQVTQK